METFFVADADISREVRLLIESDFVDLFQELNIPISTGEIINAIKDLKNGKCGGDDLLINELFIHGRDVLCLYMLHLFNFIFDSGIFLTCGVMVYCPLYTKEETD